MVINSFRNKRLWTWGQNPAPPAFALTSFGWQARVKADLSGEIVRAKAARRSFGEGGLFKQELDSGQDKSGITRFISLPGVTQLSTCAKGLDFTRLRYCRLKALRPEASFKKTKRKRQLC